MYRAFVDKKKAEIKVLELEICDLALRLKSMDGDVTPGESSGT